MDNRSMVGWSSVDYRGSMDYRGGMNYGGLEGVQGGRHGGHDDAGHAEGSGRDQRPDVPGEEGHDGLHRGRSGRGREGDGRDHGHHVQPPGHCEGHDWSRYIPEND